MATRRPLVSVAGTVSELPAADTLTASGSTGQVQFNSSGAVAGAARLSIDAADGLPMHIETTSLPAAPAAGRLKIFARKLAGLLFPQAMRSNGTVIPLQPHLGFKQVGQWLPNALATISTLGMATSKAGTTSHPSPTSGSLKDASCRWRNTSAATAGTTADERGGSLRAWRGNAAGLGGFTYMSRFALTTLISNSVAFFGLNNGIGPLSATLALNSLVDSIGVGFTNGTNTTWQVVSNDAVGVATLTNTGIPFNTTDLFSLIISCGPNESSIGVYFVNDTTGASFEVSLTTDLPVNTAFMCVRAFLTNVATASAVAYDVCRVYLESDF